MILHRNTFQTAEFDRSENIFSGVRDAGRSEQLERLAQVSMGAARSWS